MAISSELATSVSFTTRSLTMLLHHPAAPVSPVQAHTFELDLDTAKFGEYLRGGIVTQHKEHKKLSFRPLSEALENPGELLLSDFSKTENCPQLHLAFQALDAYQVRTTVVVRYQGIP